MNGNTWVFKTLQAVGAAVAAFFVALNPVYWVLLGFMGLDIATGILAAFASRTLDSAVSFRGITKKVLALLIVVAAAVLGANSQSLGLSFELPLGEAVAIYYIVNEALSVIENAARAGVPIPPVLTDALAKLGGGNDGRERQASG